MRGALRSVLFLTCGGLLSLTACSEDLPPPTYSGDPFINVGELMQTTVNARAVALQKHDITRFRLTLDHADTGLIGDQQVYYDNLAQLPIEVLRYRVLTDTITLVEGSDDYWAEVVLALKLNGYDAAPVRSRDRFLFTPSEDGRHMLISSTTDYEWEADHPGNVQPWDLGEVQVEERSGVLGVFDDYTEDSADDVLDAMSGGRDDVRAVIGDDNGKPVDGVVVYSLQDPTFLRGLANQTVGDPDRADGLTIAVPVDAGTPSKGAASFRMFLNPRVLDQAPVVLGRLVRHELTHALLGARGRGAPLWLNEGLAEYVSVRPMPPAKRRLPASALSVGATALDLPGEAEFAGPDAEGWYAVSWWVCEYIASAYGEDLLLLLLDRLEGGADQAEALQAVLGITSSQLAQRGVALMTTTYDR
ncbi:hypothetical protein [Nocardioides sp. WS12]|uniref:hypothetical protein n=1 Tax=Nocardioides sp. WS12 TaxID=2486272 RepID=UPI0015FB076B|nr:hypothetical protein [Nocardioides sp. WS12]